MKTSHIKRKDIDLCAFLIKMLGAGKFEAEGSAIASMHETFEWVQGLATSMANAYNAENPPQETSDGPTNVKVTNPVESI